MTILTEEKQKQNIIKNFYYLQHLNLDYNKRKFPMKSFHTKHLLRSLNEKVVDKLINIVRMATQ